MSGKPPIQVRERNIALDAGVTDSDKGMAQSAEDLLTSAERVLNRRQREKERDKKVSPSPPSVAMQQPRRRSFGGLRLPMNVISSPPEHLTGSNTARDGEGEIEPDKDRDRSKGGRVRGAGAFQYVPFLDRKGLEIPMISLAPNIQKLLQPSTHLDSVNFGVAFRRDKEKDREKDATVAVTSAAGRNMTPPPIRYPPSLSCDFTFAGTSSRLNLPLLFSYVDDPNLMSRAM